MRWAHSTVGSLKRTRHGSCHEVLQLRAAATQPRCATARLQHASPRCIAAGACGSVATSPSNKLATIQGALYAPAARGLRGRTRRTYARSSASFPQRPAKQQALRPVAAVGEVRKARRELVEAKNREVQQARIWRTTEKQATEAWREKWDEPSQSNDERAADFEKRARTARLDCSN